MLKILERNISSAADRLLLLAPVNEIPRSFENVTADSEQHVDLLHQIQRMRGSIYLKDGALRRDQLTRDGRHETADDARSWHLVVLDEQRQVSGCIWYLQHQSPSFEALRARHAALTKDPAWGLKFRAAVEHDIRAARDERIGYAEVGGWAVSCSSRVTDCLLLLLGTYGLSQTLGGAFVVATATLRHSSAAVLRRIGGGPLRGQDYEIPRYFDPNYDCDMELLRFDTRKPSPRFVRMVNSLKGAFDRLAVYAPGDYGYDWSQSATPLAARASVSGLPCVTVA